jgi:predicted RNA binding protein YcfA (HicA-like mRNA interferase family)
MKKIPRNISGEKLVKVLQILGYVTSRQIGSHIRLTTKENGEHHLTIPNHDPIKIGTLSNIINEIALHFKLSKEELIEKIF